MRTGRAGELAARVGKSPTVVSQHLAKLRWGKIVKARQEGTRVYYSLVDDHARFCHGHRPQEDAGTQRGCHQQPGEDQKQ